MHAELQQISEQNGWAGEVKHHVAKHAHIKSSGTQILDRAECESLQIHNVNGNWLRAAVQPLN